MENNNQNNAAIAIVIIVIFIIGSIIWQFSKFLGLDIETGAKVFMSLLGFAILWGLIWKFLPLNFSLAWPFILACLWLAFIPALDYWGTNSTLTEPTASNIFDAPSSGGPKWFATWYFQLIVFSSLSGLGVYKIKNS